MRLQLPHFTSSLLVLHLLLMWLGFAHLMHRPFHSSGMDILPLEGERPLLPFSPAFAALAFSFGPVRVAFSCFLAFMYIFMTRFISGMVGFSMRLHSVSMPLSWTPVSMRNIMCSSNVMRWMSPSSARASSSSTKASTVSPLPVSCFISQNSSRRVKRGVLARNMASKISMRLSLVGGSEGRTDLTAL